MILTRFHRVRLLALLWVGLLPLGAAALDCAQCGRQLPANSKYLQAGNKAFCSQRCFAASLPKCANCGQPCRGGFERNGRMFCSQACLATTFPQCQGCGRRAPQGAMVVGAGEERFFCADCLARPRCFCCSLPGADAALSDGRHLCRECAQTAVADPAVMLKVVQEVRQKLKDELALGTDHPIQFAMVDRPTLVARGSGRNPEREMGLYHHAETVEKTTRRLTLGGVVIREKEEEKVSDEQDTILLLSHLPLAKLREVAAHELAHDWMQERYPNLADLKLKEGWAEYIAFRVNALYRQEALNRRIAANADPVYGEGFRLIKQWADQGGLAEVMRRFAEANRAGGGQPP